MSFIKDLLLVLLLTLISCNGRQRGKHEKEASRPHLSWLLRRQPKKYLGNPQSKEPFRIIKKQQINPEKPINKGSYRQMPKLGPIGRYAMKFAQRFPKIVENMNYCLENL